MSDLGMTFQPGGKLVLSGTSLLLSKRLDALFSEWAQAYGAKEYSFPPLFSLSELAKTDYLSSFPHLATFAAPLKRQDEPLASASDVARRSGEVDTALLEPPREILSPAACYPAYAHLQRSRLSRPLYLTMRGWCFRREDEYTMLERQSCFSMREIVCIGSAGTVKDFLASERARLERVFASWRLPVSFETATDPFFGGPRHPKQLAQRLEPVKFEMMFRHRLAIGSTNFHRNYFGEVFEIELDGAPAFSGCVAFGIERWIASLLEAFGTDLRNFPEPLRGDAAPP